MTFGGRGPLVEDNLRRKNTFGETQTSVEEFWKIFYSYLKEIVSLYISFDLYPESELVFFTFIISDLIQKFGLP